ncbi:MAG: DUF4180 domain-containing protein [Caulobacteraceae bacterium]
MTAKLIDCGGRRVLLLAADGPLVGARRDAADLSGEALQQGARVIAAPAARLDPAFFILSSGLAGEFLQTLVNYRRIFAVVGDIAAHTARSAPLRDFVRESNRGRSVLFVADLKTLAARIEPGALGDDGGWG